MNMVERPISGRVDSKTLIYVCIVAMGGFVFGFDVAVISGLVSHVKSAFDLYPWQIGALVSAPTLSAVIAFLTVGVFSDLFGRKKILMVMAFLYLVSALASAAAQDLWTLILARALGGYAFGALGQAAVYIAEISPASNRGRMVSINQLAIVTGILVAYASNLGIQQSVAFWSEHGIDAWRVMVGAEAVPALLWLIGLMFIPESPRWLATQSRWAEAEHIIAQMASDRQLSQKMQDMRQEIGAERLPMSRRLGLLFGAPVRFALLIGVILAIIQQITGINVVFFYATTIFELGGAGTELAFTWPVFVGLVNIVFTLLAILLIDRLGRRFLMIAGLVGVALSLLMVAWGFGQAEYLLTASDIENLRVHIPLLDGALVQDRLFESDIAFRNALTSLLGYDLVRDHEALFLVTALQGNPHVILLGILFFIASYAVSLGPVMWVYLSEIFPNHVRGSAISFVSIFNSGASCLVQFMFPIQYASGSIAGIFVLYACFAFLGLCLVAWLMPETKGLSLEAVAQSMRMKR